MIARVEDLLALLQQEATTYRRLLTLLREEEDALLAGRYYHVAACTTRTETLLLELRVLAESRSVLLARVAEALGVAPQSLTLSLLAERVDPLRAGRLLELRAAFTETLSQIARANHGLGLLLERSLFRIREALRLLRESLGFGPQYDSVGRLLVPPFPVLDQEA